MTHNILSRYTLPLGHLALAILLVTSTTLDAGSCRNDMPGAHTPLTELSLEELMQIEITSLGKKPQPLSNAAAPVFVITNKDIRRSGVTSIADALRMAPGLHVSKLNSHAWAVSARGFNSFFADKMLVLMDGRNVYSSTYGGVYWDEQDILLEDIDRIEVIRGPAGTIWGANAVNGVINIISRCSKDTQGDLLTAGLGKEDKAFIGYRHGGKIGSTGHYRAYLKAHDYDGYADTRVNDDEWGKIRAGFRADTTLSPSTTLNISGDVFRQRDRALDELNDISVREKVTGGNMLAKWEHDTSTGSHLSFQTSIDHTRRKSPIADISVNTLDFDFQHRFEWGDTSESTWGIGYRYTSDDTTDKPFIKFRPADKDFNLHTAFLQNQFRLYNDKLHLTIGSKFEHNDFTGTEIQPSIRAIWFAHKDLSVWASASHAVHTVSRAFTAVVSTVATTPALVQFIGDENLDAENADVLELGLRGTGSGNLTWDAAFFYAKYNDLLDTRTDLVPTLPGFQTRGKNHARATTRGAELALNWEPTRRFHLKTAYTYLDIDADSADDPGFNINLEGRNPRHQLSLRPAFDIGDNIDLDFWLRYVDGLQYTLDGGTSIMKIDAHVGLDARLAWRPNKSMEVALVGQNLLEPEHVEFGPDGNNQHATSVERNLYVQLRWMIR